MKMMSGVKGVLWVLFLGTSGAFAQGWTELPNTTFLSVCVPNHFNAGVRGRDG